MKITHLCNQSRSSIGITQGLISIGSQLSLSQKYVSLGETIKLPEADLYESMKRSDLIFAADQEPFHYEGFLDAEGLWNRVIHYDYRDTCEILQKIANKARISFKRSITCGPLRIPINKHNITPIYHCALDEYYLNENIHKNIDIGCFFNRDDPQHLGTRRQSLVENLSKYDLPNCLIGHSTGQKQMARLALSKDKTNNCFHDFIHLQHGCKIIFTAQPTHCEGDNRTWEAMASGALVFMDSTHQGLKPLIDGKHCFIFDANKPDTIHKAMATAQWLLKNESKRSEIAKTGYEYVRQHHRPINRVLEMLWQTNAIKTFL